MQDLHPLLPNLRHVAATLAVLRLGSVTAASSALNLTQPAISQAVSRLEQQLGVMLFYRESSGMVGTPALHRAVPHLSRLLEHVHAGLAETGSEAGHQVTATHLRAVLDLTSHGSLAAAARARATSRATLHRPIRELQNVLGVALLEATSHGLRPTRTALRLARRVHLACVEWRASCSEVSEQTGRATGMTIIGAMPLARSVVVPAALLALAEAYPAHRISVLDGPYESMLEALLGGQADLLVGALRETTSSQVSQTPLFDDPLIVVARAGHPLARQTARARALRMSAWIAPRASSPLRRRFDELIGHSGPTTAIECNSLVAARELLLSSDRLMLTSQHQVRRELVSGTLERIAHPFGEMSRTIGLTQRRDWVPTTAQRFLLQQLQAEAARL